MNICLIFFTFCVLFYRHVESAERVQAGPIGTFIQTNIIGFPLLHESQKWIFDPDIALKRRKDFIQVNGDKGEKLIEKLGLGVDDRKDERSKRQKATDEGGSIWLKED